MTNGFDFDNRRDQMFGDLKLDLASRGLTLLARELTANPDKTQSLIVTLSGGDPTESKTLLELFASDVSSLDCYIDMSGDPQPTKNFYGKKILVIGNLFGNLNDLSSLTDEQYHYLLGLFGVALDNNSILIMESKFKFEKIFDMFLERYRLQTQEPDENLMNLFFNALGYDLTPSTTAKELVELLEGTGAKHVMDGSELVQEHYNVIGDGSL